MTLNTINIVDLSNVIAKVTPQPPPSEVERAMVWKWMCPSNILIKLVWRQFTWLGSWPKNPPPPSQVCGRLQGHSPIVNYKTLVSQPPTKLNVCFISQWCGLVEKSNHLGHIHLSIISSPQNHLGVMPQSTIYTPYVKGHSQATCHLKTRAATVARCSWPQLIEV